MPREMRRMTRESSTISAWRAAPFAGSARGGGAARACAGVSASDVASGGGAVLAPPAGGEARLIRL
jgi:hypothetical protein